MTSAAKDHDPFTNNHSHSDPVRIRRGIISKWTNFAKRIGYLCFLVSIVAVAIGLSWRFTPLIGRIGTLSLILGSVLLAPAIVLGYAVKAADREDRKNGL